MGNIIHLGKFFLLKSVCPACNRTEKFFLDFIPGMADGGNMESVCKECTGETGGEK